ncbi:hypothetical protein [Streptomyces somaliensis]|uniref:hypothetical protein n=1 Tax=Streptomyces somaliensis TaxID=78355 RepID=UPI0034E94476
MPGVGAEVGQGEERQGEAAADLVEDDLLHVEQGLPAQAAAVEPAARPHVLDAQRH